MKTLIQTKQAKQAVKFAAGIVSRRTVLPILSNVQIYSNGHFEIIGTDLDVHLIARCAAQTEIEGKTTVPARAFVELMNGKDALEISTDENHIATVKTGVVSREIPGIDPAEFPPLAIVPPDARKLTVPADVFLSALRRVENAISTDESRYVLNGVCLEISPECLRMVATDGRRLHTVEIPREPSPEIIAALNAAREIVLQKEKELNLAELNFPSTTAEATPEVVFARAKLQQARDDAQNLERGESWIIPTKAVLHLLKLPIDKKSPGEISLAFWQNRVETSEKKIDFHPMARFDYGANFTIQTKLVEGNFPNWRQVVPLEFKEEMELPGALFRAALADAEKVTTDKDNSVRLEFSENLLTVTAKSDIGKISVPVPIQYTPAQPWAIAFNPAYLMGVADALQDCSTIRAHFIDELSPGVFTVPQWRAVVMPMRLS